MKHLALLLLVSGLVSSNVASALTQEPLLTSWYTTNSAQYARVYETKAKRTSGTSSTTWTNQALPSYSDIQVVSYSSSWVYVQYSGLSSYVMGPWLNPQGGVFQFWPTNQHAIRRFPRTPVVQSGTKDATSGGYSGLYVNGVAIFNALDGQAWDGTQIQGNAPHTQSAYYWHRNAPVAESFNFDYALGHQPPTAIYHTHQNPIGLRYQLGDHVDYDSSTKNYSESADTPTKHSPIIGWAHDGYPIYGPYGYSTATDANSGIRRMVAGYVKRDGSNGTDSVDSNRSTIPAWYARFRQNHFGGGYSTTAGVSRPAVNSTYTLGTFAEDWSYMGDLTNPADSQPYEQGVDFDLDEYNGRYCVTPEYPGGTYAYFVAIDSSGASTYPYVFGYEFYGDATGGSVVNISESVTTNYVGGAYTSVDITSTSADSGSDTVTLVWNSVEGGTYQIEKSDDGNTWSTAVASVSATPGTTTQSSFTGNGGTGYTRVTRTALASYDSVTTGNYSTIQTDATTYTTPLPVIYVNAARAGQATQDGKSWATAYAYLQDAINDAQSGDEIWVAAGVYYPDEAVNGAVEVTDNDRGSSFEIPDNVGVYGGFNGTETARSQRDPSANLTVLSGDLDKNDTTVNGVVVTSPEANTTGSNAYHVVVFYEAASAVLDGFTITAGRADSTGDNAHGGGVWAKFSTPTISQCVLQGNYAINGAGIYSDSPSDDVTWTKLDVLANTADEGPAGIYFSTHVLNLDSCRIQGNISLPSNYFGYANAVYVIEGSLTMSNCLVSGNYGKFNSNIYVTSEGSTLSLAIYNSTITGNYSDTSSGASTAGVQADGKVDFRVYNSIIWGNVSVDGTDNVTGLDAQYYSLIEGKNPGSNGNLDGADANNTPLFLSGVTASSTATTSGDFRLYGNSPGIDVGDNTAASDLTSDLAGNSRVVNTTVDLGAYEYNGPTVSTAVSSQTVSPTGGATQVVDLDNVFSGTGLTFGISASGNSGLFDATIATGNVVTITPLGGTGSGSVTVTATDSSGNKYSLSFTVVMQATAEPAYGLTQMLNSWLTNYTGRYARIYETYADEQAGNAVTTWDNGTYAQSTPVYGGVQKVQYSTDYVYVLTTGLASGHVMGPWYNDTGPGGSLEVFRNWPEAIYSIYRIPTQPVIPTTKTTYPGGAIGLMVDGTIIFSESDSYSWDNAGDGTGNGSDTGPTVGGGLGDGIFLHDAYLTEGNTFDKSNAHAAGNQLHYHASPMKLRHLLGDSVDAVLQGDGSYVYTENFNGKHSPILGWLNDGIPLYGPYGYSDPMDPNSGVRRMVSGFIVRNGANGSYDTAANGRTKLPAWSARYHNRSADLNINEQGPTTATLDVPYFMEDYDYLGDLTNPTDGQPYEQGVDFDLNEYNARFCVTPEFPNGTWAYFVSIGADGKPAFPYNVGAQYFGDPSRGGTVSTIDETVTTTFVGGPDAQIKMNTPTADDGAVTLTWSAVEGGTYTVQGKTSVNDVSWSTVASGVKPTLDVGQSSDNSGGSQRFYQVVRTALDAYDATGKTSNQSGGSGGSGGTGGTGGSGGAPSISQVSPNSATESATVTVSITLSGDNLPPSDAVPTSVTIGTVSGTSITYNGSVVTASFTFPTGTTGAKDVAVTFPPPPDDDALVVTATGGFTINAMSGGGSGGGAPTISQVSPNSATEGATVTVSITLSGDNLPPSDAIPTSVTIGTVSGTSIAYNGSVVTASFTFPTGTTGAKDVTVTFPPPPDAESLVVTATSGFTINAMSGGGGGGVVTFNATFPTDPPLPPQNAIEAAAVGTVSATIISYDQNTGAVTLQFDNSTLSAGNYSATLKFTPPSDTQHTVTSSNQYTKN